MDKLADISAFEGIQNGANRSMGLSSEMAVFNDRKTADLWVNKLVEYDYIKFLEEHYLEDGEGADVSCNKTVDDIVDYLADKMWEAHTRDPFTVDELTESLRAVMDKSIPDAWIKKRANEIRDGAIETYDVIEEENEYAEVDPMIEEVERDSISHYDDGDDWGDMAGTW